MLDLIEFSFEAYCPIHGVLLGDEILKEYEGQQCQLFRVSGQHSSSFSYMGVADERMRRFLELKRMIQEYQRHSPLRIQDPIAIWYIEADKSVNVTKVWGKAS